MDRETVLRLARNSGVTQNIYGIEIAHDELVLMRFAAAVEANCVPVEVDVRGWMPIETAPKDGRYIWTFDPNDHQCVGYWFHCDEWEGWMFADELLADAKPDGLTPTHWMPLPDAP